MVAKLADLARCDNVANGATSILTIIPFECCVYNITVEDAIKMFKAPLVKILYDYEAVATYLTTLQGTLRRLHSIQIDAQHSV